MASAAVSFTVGHGAAAGDEAFDYVVVNRRGRLDDTVDTVLSIIHAEKHRVKMPSIGL